MICFLTKIKKSLILSFILSSPLSAQSADVYCQSGYFLACEGCTATQAVKVTSSSTRKPNFKGITTSWCTWSWSGQETAFNVIEKPKLGEIKTSGYRLSYRSSKAGKDHAIVDVSWNLGGKRVSSKVIYDITVVDGPQ